MHSGSRHDAGQVGSAKTERGPINTAAHARRIYPPPQALALLWFADTDDFERAHEMLECSLMLGHQFKVKLAGWRRFCNEHGFDPDNCWKKLPGYDTVCRTELLSKHAAFSAEEANAFLQRHGRERPASIAEDIATGLGEALNVRLDFWG
jgi:hypothetical protein